jgi:enoyl-[acyl-carrier-protein] reductase (NADH)
MSRLDLTGKRCLVVGIANANSSAYGCAKAFQAAGADLAITYLNAKAAPYVRPLAEKLASPIVVPCDVRAPGQLDAVFEHVRQQWGRLDFVLHSIAYAPKDDLYARVVDCSQAGFLVAMDVSCHSVASLPSRFAAQKKSSSITTSWGRSRRRSKAPCDTWPPKSVWVITTKEELMIGRHTLACTRI